MRSPLVSVIVPTFNRPRLLAECLQSLALDPYRHFQVIVVNDGGPDVEAVVQQFRSQLSVTLLQLSVNRGHVHARNQGVRASEGDVLVLCDDDDLLLPGHIQRMVQFWRQEPALLHYSDAEIVTYKHAGGRREPVRRAPFAFDFDAQFLRRWNTVIPSGVLYPAELHEEIGMFDEEMRDYWDWDFFLRVAETRTLSRVPYASVLYMVSELGYNQSANQGAMKKSLQRLIQKHRLPDPPVSSFPLMLGEAELELLRRPTRLVWSGALPPGYQRTPQ